MSEINWKSKYEAIKANWMESVDTAFRLGYEQGTQDAQVDAMAQQQQQQADEMAQQMGMQGEQGEDPNQDPNAGPEMGESPSAHPGGSELDQHISTLEGMLGKSELNPADLIKAVKGFRELQKNIKLQSDLKKSAEAIKGISKALHKPKFKISQQANANLTSSAKKAVSMQEKIVTDIMKTWDEEKDKTGKDILSQLKVEGVLGDKKE